MDNNISETRAGYGKHSDHPLKNKFKVKNTGSWGGLKWTLNDVGSYSDLYTDRNGFESRYVRFKGQKTAKVFPESLFNKYFEKTTEKEYEKWLPSKEKSKFQENFQMNIFEETVGYGIKPISGGKWRLYKDMGGGMIFNMKTFKDKSSAESVRDRLRSELAKKKAQKAAKVSQHNREVDAKEQQKDSK